MTNKSKKINRFIRSPWAEWIYVNLPFVFYLVLLSVVYIFNTHAVERSLREITDLKKEVNEYRYQSMNLNQELMYESTQSQLTKNLQESGIKPLNKLPHKIKVDKDK
jgi:hypothetical protein